MSDVRLNDKSVASDAAYIYAETASGEQVRISKADLATVVSGVVNKDSALKNALLSSFQGDMATGSCDDLPTGSMYSVYEGVSNRPSGQTGTGIAITLGTISNYRFQIYSSGSNNDYYIRKFIYGKWTEWTKLS